MERGAAAGAPVPGEHLLGGGVYQLCERGAGEEEEGEVGGRSIFAVLRLRSSTLFELPSWACLLETRVERKEKGRGVSG